MDKRVLRTKQSIKTAFMQLTLEKEVGKISVTDVAEKAGINRSTFYLHYADVQSIADDIDKEFAYIIQSCLEGFDISDIYGSVYNLFAYLTATLDKEGNKKNFIIFSTESANTAQKLKSMLTEKATNAIIAAFPATDKNALVIPLNYAAAGIVDGYINWVRAGDERQPLETLVRQTSDITDYIIENITIKKRV